MKTIILRSARCLFGLILCLSLSACLIRPYKFDVIQGNELTADKIAEVERGMTEDQVRYILGTPMLNDVFHNNRWDYIYIDKPGYGKTLRRHLAIHFTHGRVDHITRDHLPEN